VFCPMGTSTPLLVRTLRRTSIGFQPVPMDHCGLPCEIGDAGMAQSRRSIAARYRLEAYGSLHPPSALKITASWVLTLGR
jgi:hypothetical protein